MIRSTISLRARAIGRCARTTVEALERRTFLSGSIAGVVWNDANGNAALDNGESGLGNWTVYLDQNRNAARDAGEAFTTSAADGSYAFPSLAAGTYFVSQETKAGWNSTFPNASGARRASLMSAAGTAAPVITTTNSQAPVTVQGEAVPAGVPMPQDAQSGPLIRLNQFQADARYAGLKGSGFSVAVLDTGIDLDHPSFGPDADFDGIADRIVYQYDFADGDADASDVDGHGSNVTSIAAGSDAANPGMAPDADIIALKVFPDSGAGSFGYIESALQWVLAHADAYKITAVNLSLGDGQNWATSTTQYGLNDEIAALATKHVMVVSSAGNDYYSYQTPGVSYPAADPNALAVGAVYDADVGGYAYSSFAEDYTTAADRIASFSQRSSSLITTFAPGALISGADAYGGTSGYTGTSQAAPHVAGAAVLAQQLADQHLGRRLTVAEFRNLLKTTGASLFDGDDEDDNVENTNLAYSRLDVKALADAIYALGAPPNAQVVNLADGQSVTNVRFGNRAVNAAPGAPDLQGGSDTGTASTDNVTRWNGTNGALKFTVAGTRASATVQLFVDGALVATAPAVEPSTTLTIENLATALADGSHVITAKQVLPGAPASSASVGLTIMVDTVAPTAPVAPDLQAASDSGFSNVDNVTNDATPTFAVAAGTGNAFHLYRNGLLISGAQYHSGSSYTPATALGNGAASYAVGAVDPAGNETVGANLNVTIDTVAPAIPGAPDLLATSDTGASNTDNETTDQTPTFAVTGAAPYYRVYRGGTKISADYESAANYTAAVQPNGTYGYTVAAVDAAGNASGAGAALNVKIVPTVTAIPGGPYNVAEGASLALSGSATVTAGRTVAAYEWDLNYDGSTFQSDATGASASFAAASIDGPATRQIALRVRDDLGNFSSPVATTVTVNNAAPTATFKAAAAGTVGTPVSFEFTGAKDPSPADASAGFRYAYDFNNDRDFSDPGEVSNSTSANASYTFAAAGTFNVRGRITDRNGGYTEYVTPVTVTSAAMGTPVTYQVESGTFGGGTKLGRSNPGYTGAGYADFALANSYVEFNATTAVAGTHGITARFANGSTTARPLTVIVNGVTTGTINAGPTGGWATWSEASINATLRAGNNVVRIVVGANSPDLDRVTITPPATPPQPGTTQVILQAEAGTLSTGTKVVQGNSGYTGNGYVDYPATNGAYVQFAVNRASAGPVTLTARFANGHSGAQLLTVVVNGKTVGTISAGPTGGWSKWGTASLSTSLLAGANTVRLVAGPMNPDLDSLTVTSSVAAPSATTYQLESATMAGGVGPSRDNAGYTGTGYVDYSANGAYVQVNVSRASAGNAALSVRYANGSTAGRPLTVIVNGTTVGTIACAPTGGWTQWATSSLTGSVALLAGNNVIRFVAGGAGPNLDSLTVT